MADDCDRAQAENEQRLADALAAHKRNHPTTWNKPPPPVGHPLLNQGVGQGVVICTDCDEPIPARRLEVKPDATRCVDCQSEFETLSRDIK